MKKIFALFLALCMIFGMVACSDTPTVTETMTMPVTSEPETVPADTTVTEETVGFIPSPEAPILDFDITGFDVMEDYEGNPVLAIYLIWTNTTDETAMFATTYGVRAFQDGIGLEPAIMILEDDLSVLSSNTMTEIRPDATLEVVEFFLLRSDTPTIEVEVDNFIDFDGKPLMLLTVDTSAKG